MYVPQILSCLTVSLQRPLSICIMQTQYSRLFSAVMVVDLLQVLSINHSPDRRRGGHAGATEPQRLSIRDINILMGDPNSVLNIKSTSSLLVCLWFLLLVFH